MLKAIHHPRFKKELKKLPPKIREQFGERFLLFLADPRHPLLKDHALTGRMKDRRAFWVTGDFRTVYRYIEKNVILLLEIGTHNQVY